MTNQEPKWLKHFDPTQSAHFDHYVSQNWTTLASALRHLTMYAEDVEIISRLMEESNFNAETCVELAIEEFSEPPGEYFGDNWNKNRSYDGIYTELQRMTNEGYDVREQWRAFKSAMADIWKRLPRYYKGLRVYIDNKPEDESMLKSQFVEQYKANREALKNELYRDTELPSDYDSLKPFPQYQIPSDIDE